MEDLQIQKVQVIQLLNQKERVKIKHIKLQNRLLQQKQEFQICQELKLQFLVAICLAVSILYATTQIFLHGGLLGSTYRQYAGQSKLVDLLIYGIPAGFLHLLQDFSVHLTIHLVWF